MNEDDSSMKDQLFEQIKNADPYLFTDKGIVRPMLIDRELANEMLSRVNKDRQRNRSESQVKLLTRAHDTGRFVDLINPIMFNKKMECINGQSNLEGFRDSKAPTMVGLVVVNYHPDAYIAVDRNRRRSLADAFKWEGYARPKDQAGVARVMVLYFQDRMAGTGWFSIRGGGVDPNDAILMREQHPEIEKHLWKMPFIGREFDTSALRSASVIIHNICGEDQTPAAKFFDCLITGDNIPTGHPVGVLRHEMMNIDKRWREGETMARIFKAWNAHLDGKKISNTEMTVRGKRLEFENPRPPMPIPESPRPIRKVM